MRILVRGWRFLPHSYAMVNQFQLLEMLRRPALTVYHEDAPLFNAHWQAHPGLFGARDEAALRAIGPLPAGATADAELRISFPYDLVTPARADRTCVFGTAEFGVVPPGAIAGGATLAEAHRAAPEVVLITPSRWSRAGFVDSGADPARLEVVPHGVDTAIFAPATDEERSAARTKFGLDPAAEGLVFLHIGGVFGNKGLALLLRAFAAVLKQHPSARLIVKGLDALYPSKDMLLAFAGELSDDERRLVEPRLRYVGTSLSMEVMRELYHCADCYVSPYFAEGFNLPVLEAAACGLAIVCTAGGPTDDFTTPDFTLRIDSARQAVTVAPGVAGTVLMPSYDGLVEHMLTVAQERRFREQARDAGPGFVRRHFTWTHAVDRLLEVLSSDSP